MKTIIKSKIIDWIDLTRLDMVPSTAAIGAQNFIKEISNGDDQQIHS
jgi:hypothetical protein